MADTYNDELLDWDSELENDGQQYVTVPPGDYTFTVTDVERGNFNGSDKLSPCKMVTIKGTIDTDLGNATFQENLYLVRKQEWKLSDRAGTHMSQDEYKKLRENGDNICYDTAKKLIVEEFGFQLDKIEIITKVETFEVSRHYRLRRKDTFTREPLYNATDWNYIRFNVGNLQYEMINGDLEQYCD